MQSDTSLTQSSCINSFLEHFKTTYREFKSLIAVLSREFILLKFTTLQEEKV